MVPSIDSYAGIRLFHCESEVYDVGGSMCGILYTGTHWAEREYGKTGPGNRAAGGSGAAGLRRVQLVRRAPCRRFRSGLFQ